jgi:hypothetical protein
VQVAVKATLEITVLVEGGCDLMLLTFGSDDNVSESRAAASASDLPFGAAIQLAPDADADSVRGYVTPLKVIVTIRNALYLPERNSYFIPPMARVVKMVRDETVSIPRQDPSSVS